MAQTIAMQRGTTTVNCNGVNRYVLFTQSGGNATRVIINGLASYADSNANYWIILLSILNSGTSIYLPVGIKAQGQTSSGGIAYLPNNINGNTGAQRASTTDTINGVSGWSPNVNTWPRAEGVVFATQQSASMTGSGNTAYEFCPQNIWLGNGDSLVATLFNSASLNAYLAWNLTTITES